MRDGADVAVVRSFVEAFQRGDLDALAETLDPAAELHEWPDGPEARTYRGPDGVRAALVDWSESWEHTVHDSKILRVEFFTDTEAARVE